MEQDRRQVSVYATITALADLVDPGQDGYRDTAAPAPASNDMWALPQPSMAAKSRMTIFTARLRGG